MISSSILEKLEYNKVLQYISKYCYTEKGKQDILSLTPFADSNPDPDWIATGPIGIINEGKSVTQAKEILIKNQHPPIEYLTDLSGSLSKSNIEGTFLESKKILEILKLAVISRNLFQFLKNNSEEAPYLFKIAGNLYIDRMLEHHIQKIIGENGEIKENASSKLSEIRKEIRSKKDDLIKSVNRIVKSLRESDITREDYLTLRDGRIVIPVRAEHKRHIRGFIHSESSTGQTVYIEPEETLELNNEIVSLSFAEKREIERLLKELTKKIGSVSSELKNSLSVIANIDSIFSRAQYSIEIIGTFPQTDQGLPFYIQDARHPLLLKKMGREKTIPLKIKVDNKKIIIITGPNAGGKTVVLKTVGLLALMVKSGIHIPVNPDSNFHLFEKILIDIGDEQSIEDDLSTFSSHLSNIKNILNEADRNSLVLLDEIGTGTDPAEGSALAAAVLIKLREKSSTVFATTHHGSLKLIANELEGFENAAMEFDNINLKPAYNFKQGIPGSSYAFEIAKRIGLDDTFLSLAKEHLDIDKHKLEIFLVDIEAKQRSAEEKLKHAEIENARLTGLSNLYRLNMDKLNKEKKEILKKAKADADIYLKDLNKKFEKIIKDLKESNAGSETIKSSQKIIKEMKEKNEELFKEDIQLTREDYDFNVGDFASIKNTGASGEIIDISTEKNKATLQVGALKVQTSLDELAHSKKEKEKKGKEVFYNIDFAASKTRLDIRGEKPEEAEFEVIKFIDNAYSSGLDKIEILHGKGTGALKKIVKEILKNHEQVKKFYFAPVEYGGEGITIAELK